MITENSIYSFTINNHNFEKLVVELNKFNPFDVLNINHHEIRHSNVLAWLLNPRENHNLGDTILKKIILSILNDSDNEENIPENITIKDVQVRSFGDSKILRECMNIDILVLSESNHFIFLIENKIHSKERQGQLEEYYCKVVETYSPQEYRILPVYLTLGGEAPSNQKYCKFDHGTIYDIVKFTTDLYQDRIPTEVLSFIRYYLKTLEGILVMDENVRRLCIEIYREHKEIIDLIHSVGNEIDITGSIDEFKQKYPEVRETLRNNKSFWFALPDFHEAPKMSHDWAGGYPISFWYSDYYGKLKIVLEIGPFDDPELRSEFLKHLERNGIKITSRAKEIGRQYTRIWTHTVPVKDWTDQEEVIEAMIRLYENKNLRNIKERLLESIKTFQWKSMKQGA